MRLWAEEDTGKLSDQNGFTEMAVTDLVLEGKEELNSAWEA